ncbi:hypothetical protein ACIRSU_13130 [Streptomyces sp. NPDC101160]|uniref:hypothetical protein n=1 Tax=Streptomyces sp. NPDC101160 TaxID=3366118 RepID=UPI003816089E
MRVRLRAWGVCAAAAVVATALTGCGAVGDANDAMRSSSFHSSGGTTAFAGGWQEMWWNPDQGLRVKATWVGGSGEMYCKDGTTYTGAALLARALGEKGERVTVPDRLAGTYVTSELPDGADCDTYFRIPDQAERASERDRTLHGRGTEAFTVEAAADASDTASGTSSDTSSDTYYVESDTSRLVLLESTRNGRHSTTTYDSFGGEFTITLPAAERTMPLEEFRSQVTGG